MRRTLLAALAILLPAAAQAGSCGQDVVARWAQFMPGEGGMGIGVFVEPVVTDQVRVDVFLPPTDGIRGQGAVTVTLSSARGQLVYLGTLTAGGARRMELVRALPGMVSLSCTFPGRR